MAPVPSKQSSSAPLADWFFITGVDSEQLRWGSSTEESIYESSQLPVEQTIEEDSLAEAEDAGAGSRPETLRHVRRSSYNRLSRLSDEARLSIASISLSPEHRGTESNRSSVTVRGVQLNGTGSLNDADFEKALRKFASERESFLADLTLSAGAVVPNRPKPRLKTQKIFGEDNTGLKASVGSIRRRISFRDMNSMKRQSSVNRQCGFSRASAPA
ncbi:MAG: hypothetical protein Q9190_001290 [Brigantiaea leucoxantha]